MRRAPLLVLAAALVLGCGDASPPLAAPVDAPAPAAPADLPVAANVWAPIAEAPTVAVEQGRVLVDGAVVGDARAIEAAGRMQKIDGEFEALQAKRDAWKAAHPGAPFPGAALLKLPRETSARVVKSVFQTAAFAGYPSLSFAVVTGAPPVLARVEVDAALPAPPPDARDAERALAVRVAPNAPIVLAWRRGTEIVSQVEVAWTTAFDRRDGVVRAPALAAKITSEWSMQGVHRDPTDRAFDRALIEVDDGVSLGDLVAVVDALYATKRAVAQASRPMPAFVVTLSPRSATVAPDDAPRPPAGPRVATGSAASHGRLPPEVIRRIVRESFGTPRACYEAALKKKPSLTGRVATEFVIGVDGRVTKTRESAGSTLPDPAARACVVASFSALEFPPPEGGTVTVTYPIEFSPGDAPNP